MDDRELKLRLIEAAAALPGCRVGVDYHDQARRVKDVAQVWYNDFVGKRPSTRAPTVGKKGHA